MPPFLMQNPGMDIHVLHDDGFEPALNIGLYMWSSPYDFDFFYLFGILFFYFKFLEETSTVDL